jgi:hypothetical protein
MSDTNQAKYRITIWTRDQEEILRFSDEKPVVQSLDDSALFTVRADSHTIFIPFQNISHISIDRTD